MIAALLDLNGTVVDGTRLHGEPWSEPRRRLSPAGTPLGSIGVAPGVSNVAFGGADARTLYITAGKALYALDMNLPGHFD